MLEQTSLGKTATEKIATSCDLMEQSLFLKHILHGLRDKPHMAVFMAGVFLSDQLQEEHFCVHCSFVGL